jgi:serine/threonine protein kinase
MSSVSLAHGAAKRGALLLTGVGTTANIRATDLHMTGETISHYRLLEKLGSGGMGVVYAAEDLKLGRKVALKFLAIEYSRDPAALHRFEREARSASALNHPNICTIYEIDHHEGYHFIAMELLKGETLRDGIARHGMPLDQFLDFAFQIANGLDAAHSEGIIHRDIKPANIFVTGQGYVKLLDFGLAKLSAARKGTLETGGEETMSPEAMARQDLTMPGVPLGTIAYMSPEQALGEPLDARTDLFSFGVVLYQMATGRQPFAGNTLAGTVDAILHKEPSPVITSNPNIPPDLQSIISKALEKDRALRYQTAADLRADLQRVRRDWHLSPSLVTGNESTQTLSEIAHKPAEPVRRPETKPPAPQKKRIWALAAGALAIIVMTALAVRWRGTTREHADAHLKFQSNPGAQVLIDEKVSGTVEPDGTITVKVPPGEHSLRLSLTGYVPYSTRISVAVGERESVVAALNPVPQPPLSPVRLGDLVVRSNVAGADILVDGQLKGFTGRDDQAKMQLNEGTYKIQLQKSGYKDSPEQAIEIDSHRENEVSFKLAPAATPASQAKADTYLIIKSKPGADIQIDGKVSGITDSNGVFPVKVAPGEHLVQASLRGYETYSSSVPVKATGKTYLVVDLKPSAPIIASFVTSQPKITPGQTASLKWTTQNATEIRIDPGIGTVSASGTQDVSPARTTTYVLTVRGSGGSTNAKVSIAVAPNPADAQGIKETMARFKGAYDSMDISALQREWPSLTQTQADAIKTTFVGLTSIRLNDECEGSPEISGDMAEWTCKETITYFIKGRPQTAPVHHTITFHFKRAGGTWSVVRREGTSTSTSASN